jgi:hypothetical protein
MALMKGRSSGVAGVQELQNGPEDLRFDVCPWLPLALHEEEGVQELQELQNGPEEFLI